VHDLYAVQVVIDGAAAHRLVGRGQRAELVLVVLEGVGVDGSQANAQAGRVLLQGGVVIHLVPGNVQGHGGGQAGQFVDLGRIRQLLLHRPRRTGGAEHLEPGA
jgi:hypothetical protein